jgi:uncharacterized membrane protein YkvA (DUF1232 family)
MALLVRVGAIVLLWLFSKRRSARASDAARRAASLSWPQKARLIAGLSRDKRMPTWTRFLLLVPVLYVASPIDILPDLIPILGRVDDALIFSLAFDLVSRFAPPSVLVEHIDSVAPHRQAG